MPNTFQRSALGARFNFELAARQVRLKVTGPITPAVHKQMGVDLDRIASGCLARSIVVDWSQALVALPWEVLRDAPKNLTPRNRHLPVAFIAPRGSEDLLQDYAAAQTAQGLWRASFVHDRPARLWAWAREADPEYSHLVALAQAPGR
jgi:hypothetical protein